MTNTFPKLHNAMWPGLVGKGEEDGQEPPISLEHMLELTANAEVDGVKFEGVDYFLFHPHTDPDASDDELRRIADMIASYDLRVGSLVAPIWPGTVGDSAMGDDHSQEKFLTAIRKACRIARVFNEHGIRQYGVIRVDSAEFGVDQWRKDPESGTARIIDTFKKYHHRKMKIETVAYQEALRTAVKEKMLSNNLYIPGLEKGVKPRTRKSERLLSLVPMVAKGEFYFRSRDTEAQAEFLSYPKGRNDDIMDAIWTALEGARPARIRTLDPDKKDKKTKKFLDWMTL